MALVKFKLASIYEGTDSKSIEMFSINKKTNIISFVDQNGNIFYRKPHDGETVLRLSLSATEDFIYQGKQKKRVVIELSYEDGNIEKDPRRDEYLRNRAVHEFLKTHPNVRLMDPATGININANAGAMVLFELVEQSKIAAAKAEKEMKYTKYSAEIQALYEAEDKQPFVNLCYAMGIQNVSNTTLQDLYLEMLHKIKGSYVPYESVKEHKSYELYVQVKKAMQTEFDGKIIIEWKSDNYFFEEEILGRSEQEIIHYFETHPRKRENLFRKTGYMEEVTITHVEPEKGKENYSPTPQMLASKAANDAAELRQMETEVKAMFNIYKARRKKAMAKGESPAAVSAVEEEYKDEKERIRKKYLQFADAFDAACNRLEVMNSRD